MFISKLIQATEKYDPYGLYRLNGMKITYVLIIMYICNVFFNIEHPYFFYFYVPLTVMSLELIAETVKEKYTIFIHTLLQTLVLIIGLSIARSFPLFFIFFAFIGASALYLMVFRQKYLSLTAVSTSLSLAAYSFNYIKINDNVLNVFINISDSILAMFIILGACILFPRSYYYRLWLRAIYLLTQESLEQLVLNTTPAAKNKKSINAHMLKVMQFSKMLPTKIPAYSIIKINLLAYRLHSLCCVTHGPLLHFTHEELQIIQKGIADLLYAIEQEKPCLMPQGPYPLLHALIRSWNHLCLIY